MDEIHAFDSDFKVAVVPNHDDILYDFYKDGVLSLKEASDIDPSFMVIVLQKREGFFVIHQDRILEDFERTSLTPYCSGLDSQFVNYNIYANQERIVVSNDSILNPLYKKIILKDIDVIKTYNDVCGLQISTQEDRSSTSGAPRGCERDWLDDEENIERIRIPDGKASLKLFGCNWLTRHCTFRVDVFVPTAQSSNQSYYVDNANKIITERRRKLKSKNWVWTNQNVQKWRFLEGLHGDTWQYNWIGIHPKGNGSTTTTNIGFSFSPTVTFKEPISGTEVGFSFGQGLTAMHSVQKKASDFELGNDVVNYCDLSSANGWQGTTYSTGAVEFSIREGGN